MNDLKTTLKKIIHALFKKKKMRLHERDPLGDWQKILLIFLFLGLLMILGTGFYFYKINQGDVFNAAASSVTPAETLNKNLLKTDNDYYDAKEQKLGELRQEVWTPIDPSQ